MRASKAIRRSLEPQARESRNLKLKDPSTTLVTLASLRITFGHIICVDISRTPLSFRARLKADTVRASKAIRRSLEPQARESRNLKLRDPSTALVTLASLRITFDHIIYVALLRKLWSHVT